MPVVEQQPTPVPTSTAASPQLNMSFSYTGAVQQYVVPAGVFAVEIEATGAGGSAGPATSSKPPGAGGRVTGTLAVSPGQTLYVYVGGQSRWNGGGRGQSGSHGGDASDVRVGGTELSHRVIVGGGGGGLGGQTSFFQCQAGTAHGGGGMAASVPGVGTGSGGAGGSGIGFCGNDGGLAGGAPVNIEKIHGGGGSGGGLTSGGAGAQASGYGTGEAGSLGRGGDAYESPNCEAYGTGGGGGGYYGGGGAAGGNCGSGGTDLMSVKC
jgi:hypothetical protein